MGEMFSEVEPYCVDGVAVSSVDDDSGSVAGSSYSSSLSGYSAESAAVGSSVSPAAPSVTDEYYDAGASSDGFGSV